jgi:hypothetical protein
MEPTDDDYAMKRGRRIENLEQRYTIYGLWSLTLAETGGYNVHFRWSVVTNTTDLLIAVIAP